MERKRSSDRFVCLLVFGFADVVSLTVKSDVVQGDEERSRLCR